MNSLTYKAKTEEFYISVQIKLYDIPVDYTNFVNCAKLRVSHAIPTINHIYHVSFDTSFFDVSFHQYIFKTAAVYRIELTCHFRSIRYLIEAC